MWTWRAASSPAALQARARAACAWWSSRDRTRGAANRRSSWCLGSEVYLRHGLRFSRRVEQRVLLEAEDRRRHVGGESPALGVVRLDPLVVAHALDRQPVL